MEYKEHIGEDAPDFQFEPRLIIHGGAGNIPSRDEMPAETYAAYRHSLLTIVCSNVLYSRLWVSQFTNCQ